MSKIDYVVATYNKDTGIPAVRVRYENGRDVNYNPEKLPATVEKFVKTATNVDKTEHKYTVVYSYYCEDT